MKVLSIDLGASSGRTMVVTYENGLLSIEEINRFEHTILEIDNELKWDLSLISLKVKEGIKLAFDKYDDIASIGIDTWGCDYTYISDQGDLIRLPYSYRDRRNLKASKDVLKIYSYQDLYNLFGMQFLPFNSIYQIYDDFNNKNLSKDNSYTLLMIADYLAYLLTGSSRLEVTNASTMSLFTLPEFTLSSDVLIKLNIPSHIFPKLIKPGEIYGYLKEEYIPHGRKINIPVIAVCSHDTSSAILGTNVNKEDAYISSGTWSLVGVEEDKPIVNEKMCQYNLTNELGYNNKFNILKNVMGMFLVNQIRNDWKSSGEDIKTSEITTLVTSSKDIESYFDPDEEAFQTPFDMTNKMIKYLGDTKQAIPTSKGEWLKMIYLSMACKYRKVIEELEYVSNKKIHSIVICGGGNQAEILNQFTANITGKIVKQGPKEATVLGNALAQFISLGVIKDDVEGREIISHSFGGNIYYPDKDKIWKERYQSFLKIINKSER